MTIHFGTKSFLDKNKVKQINIIKKLIKIAEYPRIMMRLFKKGTGKISPGLSFTELLF